MPHWSLWNHEERGDNAHFDERTRNALFNENLGNIKHHRKTVTDRAGVALTRAQVRKLEKKEAEQAAKDGKKKPWWKS